MKKVLLITEDPHMRDSLSPALTVAGFSVFSLQDCSMLGQNLQQFSPQIILVDQRPPKLCGVDVVYQIRDSVHFTHTPIVVISDPMSEDDKVTTLNVGADDCIIKPFSVAETIARLNAVLRRCQYMDPGVIQCGHLTIDTKGRQVFLNGQEVSLTQSEFNILTELVKSKDQVVSRDEIISRALRNKKVSHRTIDVHVAAIRKKLKNLGQNIRTVHGLGFRFTPNESVA